MTVGSLLSGRARGTGFGGVSKPAEKACVRFYLTVKEGLDARRRQGCGPVLPRLLLLPVHSMLWALMSLLSQSLCTGVPSGFLGVGVGVGVGVGAGT